jgi:hypothetical protein
MPRFYIVTVKELLCGFNSRAIVRTVQMDRPNELAVYSDNVEPIIGHLRPWGKVQRLRDHKIPKLSVRDRTLEVLLFIFNKCLCSQPKKMPHETGIVHNL